ncbi:hypothetical protein C8Q74DRAFT_44034 [Fomes fomentarius]|nr:hypothetical protein C8Q74DRAFT_44034 [Fomes fomentarius]
MRSPVDCPYMHRSSRVPLFGAHSPRVSVTPAIVCPELLASYHDLWTTHRRKSSRDLGVASADISQPGSVRPSHNHIPYERWSRYSACNGFAGQSHRLTRGDLPCLCPRYGRDCEDRAENSSKCLVVGYGDAYSRQIMARRSNRGADSISLSTLATKIAEEMQKYLGDREVDWHGQALTLDDIILKRLHHVTQGSWQPEFAVLRRNAAT